MLDLRDGLPGMPGRQPGMFSESGSGSGLTFPSSDKASRQLPGASQRPGPVIKPI